MSTLPRSKQPSKREDVRDLFFEKGLTVRQIAGALGISTQGVRYHLDRIAVENGSKKRSA
jgi:predicted ArsR family transcriptional regulator